MTPDQVKKAAAALNNFNELVENWRKATVISGISLYYNGHQARDIGHKHLFENTKSNIVEWYRKQVVQQLEVLLSMQIETADLLPDDWDTEKK